ncbi:MAG: hypothetical protein VX346_04460 [Planctomycetota bacterium]|nr:hypothetical protein [Planctomycetota bacterium]
MIHIWRAQLKRVYDYYRNRRLQVRWFFFKLFLFFVVLNLSCYWLALTTAFPHLVFGKALAHYAKIQIPVGLLGALFDSLSFFVTVQLVRRALAASGIVRFLAHLSVDLFIALAATWWVLFVFVLSGWLINLLDGRIYERNQQGRWQVISIETLAHTSDDAEIRTKHWRQRTDLYRGRLVDALRHPLANLKNIYFGIIMGASAMLPTCIHLSMFLAALWHKTSRQRRQDARTSSSG